MTLDDQSEQKDRERRRLLEEIRRKAEEDELKRIEEEEHMAGREDISDGVPSPLPSTIPPSHERTLIDLRERLTVALDRGEVEKAADLFAELQRLAPHDAGLEELHGRILGLQDASRKKKSAQEPGQSKAGSGTIDELLEKARFSYEYEKYDTSLAALSEILSIDPGHPDALKLKGDVEKAQRLLQQIQREEAERKAEEAKLFPSAALNTPPLLETGGVDLWGTPGATGGEVMNPDVTIGEAPAAVSHGPSFVQKVVERLSDIHIPLKTLVIVGAIIVAGIVAYVVIDHISNAVFPPKYALLILPARNSSADSSFGYVADGLTEDLIQDLSRVEEIRVLGPATSLYFKNSRMLPHDIARSAGANYLLQWSIDKSGETTMLHMELSDTLSAQPLWIADTKSSFRELPGARQEIAGQILNKMGISPAKEASGAFGVVPAALPLAYEQYLHGRFFLQDRRRYPLPLAIQAFESACEADSMFVDAYTGLAWAHFLAYDDEIDNPTRHIERVATLLQHPTMRRAMTPEAFRVRGMIEQVRSAYDKAVQLLERAAILAPSDAETHRRLAILYVVKNRVDDALKTARLATQEDPRNASSFTILGLIQHLTGDFAGALQSYEAGMRLSPDPSEYAAGYYSDMLVYTQQPDRAADIFNNRVAQMRQSYIDYYKLGRVYQLAGKPKEEWQKVFARAKSLLEEQLRAHPTDQQALSFLALTETRLGEFKEAGSAITKAQQIGVADPALLYNIARVYAIRRDKRQALEYLSNALARRYRLASLLDMDFYYLRSEPEFLQVITR
jgi:tetratricopeptide (TPR) repeat protein